MPRQKSNIERKLDPKPDMTANALPGKKFLNREEMKARRKAAYKVTCKCGKVYGIPRGRITQNVTARCGCGHIVYNLIATAAAKL